MSKTAVISEISRMFSEGQGIQEIARQMRKSTGFVSGVLHALRVEVPIGRPKDRQILRAAKLYRRGFTSAVDLAKHLGVKVQTAESYLIQLRTAEAVLDANPIGDTLELERQYHVSGKILEELRRDITIANTDTGIDEDNCDDEDDVKF